MSLDMSDKHLRSLKIKQLAQYTGMAVSSVESIFDKEDPTCSFSEDAIKRLASLFEVTKEFMLSDVDQIDTSLSFYEYFLARLCVSIKGNRVKCTYIPLEIAPIQLAGDKIYCKGNVQSVVKEPAPIASVFEITTDAGGKAYCNIDVVDYVKRCDVYIPNNKGNGIKWLVIPTVLKNVQLLYDCLSLLIPTSVSNDELVRKGAIEFMNGLHSIRI